MKHKQNCYGTLIDPTKTETLILFRRGFRL